MATSEKQAQFVDQIADLEKKLLSAFANKDLRVIEELLHDASIFTYPNGQVVTKAMVLENYRSGNSAFSIITASDEKITIIGDCAIVSLILELKGNYFEQEISSQFRYLRVWKLTDNNWKVVAVSGVPLVN